MSRTVWKYEFQVADEVEIRMPTGAQILSVQNQCERPCLWALVDPGEPVQVRRFRVAGTGHPLPDHQRSWSFVGSFQLLHGALVFHVWEIPS